MRGRRLAQDLPQASARAQQEQQEQEGQEPQRPGGQTAYPARQGERGVARHEREEGRPHQRRIGRAVLARLDTAKLDLVRVRHADGFPRHRDNGYRDGALAPGEDGQRPFQLWLEA